MAGSSRPTSRSSRSKSSAPSADCTTARSIVGGPASSGLLGSGLDETELAFEEALERGGVAIGEPGERVVAIDSGAGTNTIDEAQVCALTDVGRVYCWGWMAADGYPGFEPIGDDETPADVGPIDLGEPAVAIAVGGLGACATLASGAVRCWGSDVLTGVATLPGEDVNPAANPALDLGAPIHALAISHAHACAIVGDGEVVCWGHLASSGELGNLDVHTSPPSPSLEPIALGGLAVEVVANDQSSCARLESGEVVCWGTGRFGKTGQPWAGDCEFVAGGAVQFSCDADPSCCVGDDETPASVGPIALPGPAVDLASTPMGACALLESGAVHCWGGGMLGLLGDDETPTCRVPDLSDVQCGLDPRCCVGDDETPAAAARPVVFE